MLTGPPAVSPELGTVKERMEFSVGIKLSELSLQSYLHSTYIISTAQTSKV